MSDPVIGWFMATPEGSSVYPAPNRIHLVKDPTLTKRGFLSCPAVRNVTRGCFEVKSYFSLRLRYAVFGDAVSITPIYPATSLNEGALNSMFRLEPPETWRNKNLPVVQLPSPYVFVSDNKIEVEQLNPILSDSSKLNWRLIPGRFDIYGWQRPLNWAFEWDTLCGDLVIKVDEPLYWVRFYNENGAVIENPRLEKIRPSKKLLERMSSFSGVTAVQRGTAKLMQKFSDERDSSLLEED